MDYYLGILATPLTRPTATLSLLKHGEGKLNFSIFKYETENNLFYVKTELPSHSL